MRWLVTAAHPVACASCEMRVAGRDCNCLLKQARVDQQSEVLSKTQCTVPMVDEFSAYAVAPLS